MKSLSLLLLFAAVSARANTFHCTETDYSSEEYGYRGSVTITISDDARTMDFETYGDGHGMRGRAYLDTGFKSETDVIYIDEERKLCASEIEPSAFLSKSLALGHPGRMVITGAERNRRSEGPAILTFTAGIFNCR